MPWIQAYDPINGSIGLSAVVAAIPIAVVFVCLAILRVKAFKAVILALASAFALSVSVWRMPAKLACLATLHGAAFGLFPVYFIVLATLFLYNITVRGGQFDVIRASLAGVTPDRRLQALLIAFCFGAFIEGAAGFGTPVAIAGATLAGLGFRPFYAAGICLVANTAPVAFGALGTAVVALGGVMGLNDAGLDEALRHGGKPAAGRLAHRSPLPRADHGRLQEDLEVLPAIVVCAVTFAGCQWAVACFLGPYLPDIIASLASMAALVLLLRVWRPRTVFRFDHERTLEPETHGYTVAQVARAWAPYFVLTFVVLLWGLPPVKAALGRSTLNIPVAGLDNAIASRVCPRRSCRGAAAPAARPAAGKVQAGLPGKRGLCRVHRGPGLRRSLCGLGAGETARLLRQDDLRPALPRRTIAAVLALAYVMNASGMTVCLGHLVHEEPAALFPLHLARPRLDRRLPHGLRHVEQRPLRRPAEGRGGAASGSTRS